jgi:hypothetical protein
MSNTSSIDNFINTNIKNGQLSNTESNKLEEEIDNIFNNMLDETCYIYYDTPKNLITIVALGVQLNLSNFSVLIPNLFRLCYAQENAQIPYICPIYYNPTNTVNYFPILIDTNLIKSFLYFNFPGSIKNFNNNYNFINRIYSYINLKKKNATYASFTPSSNIIFNIYSKDSLLLELINFNSYINAASEATSNSLLINDFKINWDFTRQCITYTTSASTVYTVGNYTTLTGDKKIDQVNASNIYNIKNSIYYIYKEKDNLSTNTFTNTDNLIIFQKYSIYTVLHIALEVFTDISEQIEYYFQNKNYCKKSYMYTYNIPVLLKIYKNYYKNQLYTINNNFNTNNPFSVFPNITSIESYVNQFISIYNSTYPDRYLIKTIYLSNVDAFVFFNSLGNNWGDVPIDTEIFYWYYYINVGNPSAIELFNTNNIISSTYTSLSDFTTAYNNAYISKYSYNIISKKILQNYGLYSNAGLIESGATNVGAMIYSFAKNGELQTILYETLQSPIYQTNGSSTTDYGIPVPGIVLSYYQNV